MGGSSTEVGRNFRVAWLDDLVQGPIDAALEFRGADKVAWKGKLTDTGAVAVDKPMLWGGDKDQGGAVGTLRWQFGKQDQMPNAYLVSVFGPKVPARRGVATGAWEGGLWGANNPFAQKRSYRVLKLVKGWDEDDCWYPATCPVPIEGTFTPGGGTYHWAIRHAGNYVAGSPEGTDWSNDDAFLEGLGAERNFGEWVVSTGHDGATSYTDWRNPGAWVDGANAGPTGHLQPHVSIIAGKIFHAKIGSYAYTTHPAVAYTQKTGRATLIAGNESAIVFYAGPNAGGYTDGYYMYRSVDGGATREHVSTIPTSPSPGADSYAYYLYGAAANDTHILFGGRDYNDNTVVFWSDDGFVTINQSTLPMGQTGELREILHVQGPEFLAFVGGPGGEHGDFLLRSTDNGESFQVVDLGTTGYFSHLFQGNAAVDPSTGQVVFILSSTPNGTRVYESGDRETWSPVSVSFAPNTIYLIAPQVPAIYGRVAMNPAHMILYAHTQEYAGRAPRDSVNLDNLTDAANWFFNQGFGLCTLRVPKDESPREFIRRIEKVAGCSFSKSFSDGQFYLDIANGEYDLDSLPIITDADILSFKESPTTSAGSVNSVSVKYFDPERKESIITPPVRAMGLIAQFGEVHQTLDYPEIPIGYIAVRVATRELLARITPTRIFELDCKPTVYALRKGQYVRVQLLKRGIADMVCLVADIPSSGSLTSGAIQLKLAQDIYSLPSTVYTSVELGEDTRPPSEPAPIVDQVAFEAPYINLAAMMTASELGALPGDAGYLVAAAVDPGQMRDFTMMVAPDGGSFSAVGDGQFSPSALAVDEVPPGQKLGIAYGDDVGMAQVQVGDVLLWINEELGDELCVVDAIDRDAKTLDLGRAVGDTAPKKHLAGSRLFFYQRTAAYDRTQYIEGESLDVKLITNSWSQQLDMAAATQMDVSMARRMDRPYPPANIKINGVSIFDVGAPSTGGGSGGGGGGSTPSGPPPVSAGGGPASTEPGPNGGFPDDQPYWIPPVVEGADVLDEDFSDPDTVLQQWRDRLGGPVGQGFTAEGGELQFNGISGTAYCWGKRFSLSPQPFPRYDVTVEMKVRTEFGQTARVGIAWGLNHSLDPGSETTNYIEASEAASYIDQTTVTHTWRMERQFVSLSPYGYYAHVNFMPVVQFDVVPARQASAAADDAKMTITEVPVDMTTIDVDNLDLSDGIDALDLWPDPDNLNPDSPPVTAVDGALVLTPTDPLRNFRNVYFPDAVPVSEVGQYVKVRALVWCDDPSVDARGITTGGAHMYLAAKTATDGYAVNGFYIAQRGDWTERVWYWRVQGVPGGSLLGHYLCAQMKCAPGYQVKVQILSVEITDEAQD